jgi:hypothetical protein
VAVSGVSSGGGAGPISEVLMGTSGPGVAWSDETMVSGKPLQAVIVRVIKSNDFMPLTHLGIQHLFTM